VVHVIAAPCIADFSCLEICPVNCIGPGPQDSGFDDAEQLYIDPTVCINCGACKDVCPVLAIYEEGDLPEKWSHYADVNREHFQVGD
jgi:ferredoxin